MRLRLALLLGFVPLLWGQQFPNQIVVGIASDSLVPSSCSNNYIIYYVQSDPTPTMWGCQNSTNQYVIINNGGGGGGGGITQLTGDVAAGPGSGSQAATLAIVNSGPGDCGDATHVCEITTDAKGRVLTQQADTIVYQGTPPAGSLGDIQYFGPGPAFAGIGGTGLVHAVSGNPPTVGPLQLSETPLTTTQDILYDNAGVLDRLPLVTSGQCLGSMGGVWTSLACSGGGGGGPVAITQLTDFSPTLASSTITLAPSINGVHISGSFYSFSSGTMITRTAGTGSGSVWAFVDNSGNVSLLSNSGNTYTISGSGTVGVGTAFPDGSYGLYVCTDTGTNFSACTDQRAIQAITYFTNVTAPYYGVQLVSGASGNTLENILPVVQNSATSYTFLPTDAHTFQNMTASAAKNVIIPAATVTGFGLGFDFVIQNSAAANAAITLTPNSASQLNINGALVANVTISGGQTYYCDSDGANYQCIQWNGSGGGGGGITALTGDVSASGSGSVVATLATVNSGPGTCGDATHVCQVTTNGKGLTTAQSAVPITFPTTPVRAIGATFDGQGSALSNGKTIYYTAPFACTINAWNMTVDTGTATIDIWKIASGTAIPTVTNTITASALPAISTGTAKHSTTLTGWTTAVTANDIFGFNINAVSGATEISIVLGCQ